MRIARLAASPSTSGGRDSGCPSGPVIPIPKISSCSRATSSPFSACTVHSAPRSRARVKLFTRISSSAMMAPL